MGRIIQRKNVKDNNCYDVRIIEKKGKDCKEYYYHFLKLSNGDSIIEMKHFKNNNMVEISWDELPQRIKEEHYNNLYPGEKYNFSKKSSFLYGKKKANESIKVSYQQVEENIYNLKCHIKVEESAARKIIDKIGKLEKVEILSKECNWIEYLVNDRWIIKTKHSKLMCIEEESNTRKQEKKWGQRVKALANQANVSYDIATVVGKIIDTNEAEELLKKIGEIVNSEKFYNEFKPILRTFEKIDKSSFELFLSRFLYEEQIKKLNWSKRFQYAIEEILKNK